MEQEKNIENQLIGQDAISAETVSHTPGPWELSETGEIEGMNGQVVIGRIYGIDDFPCADLEDDAGVLDFLAACKANGRLVIAAPDLLGACLKAREWLGLRPGEANWGRHYEVRRALWDRLDAAISKALPEPTP